MNEYLIGFVAMTSKEGKIISGNCKHKSENYPLDLNDILDIQRIISAEGFLENVGITMIYKLGSV